MVAKYTDEAEHAKFDKPLKVEVMDEFEKRIAAKQKREASEKKSNGDATEPEIYKLPCGCDTFIGEKDSFTNMAVPFPFIEIQGTDKRPILILQFCKKCKAPHKSWWEIPKPNPSKLFIPG